jgi:hypothetical protein
MSRKQPTAKSRSSGARKESPEDVGKTRAAKKKEVMDDTKRLTDLIKKLPRITLALAGRGKNNPLMAGGKPYTEADARELARHTASFARYLVNRSFRVSKPKRTGTQGAGINAPAVFQDALVEFYANQNLGSVTQEGKEVPLVDVFPSFDREDPMYGVFLPPFFSSFNSFLLNYNRDFVRLIETKDEDGKPITIKHNQIPAEEQDKKGMRELIRAAIERDFRAPPPEAKGRQAEESPARKGGRAAREYADRVIASIGKEPVYPTEAEADFRLFNPWSFKVQSMTKLIAEGRMPKPNDRVGTDVSADIRERHGKTVIEVLADERALIDEVRTAMNAAQKAAKTICPEKPKRARARAGERAPSRAKEGPAEAKERPAGGRVSPAKEGPAEAKERPAGRRTPSPARAAEAGERGRRRTPQARGEEAKGSARARRATSVGGGRGVARAGSPVVRPSGPPERVGSPSLIRPSGRARSVSPPGGGSLLAASPTEGPAL